MQILSQRIYQKVKRIYSLSREIEKLLSLLIDVKLRLDKQNNNKIKEK